MTKIVLITGATAGFGEACAEKFAKNGYDVIITGRRGDKLNEVKQKTESSYSVRVLPLQFDVQQKTAVFDAINSLPAEWRGIDVLINNAGLALGRDLFDQANMDDWETMIDTNVKGLLYVSKAVLPLMIEKGNGHIINLGSVAGKEIYERGNVYCATKAAVQALSKSMRIDLLPHRIKVTAVHPGAAETEFGLVRFKGNAEAANKVYQGYQPLSAKDVADIIFYCTTLPPHVCINDLDVTCLAQATVNNVYRSEP
ncbi:MAG: SDR family NAD(P)-dependent oxidoreductase [Williamsia sp.]|nr:SDR family NAD(P)-dependent oxidoreductase [Williamsia sp.]